MKTIDGARCFQAMVPMRDGVRLNTFVFLPLQQEPPYPVILQRTPYGITLSGEADFKDCEKGWLPDPQAPLRGSLLRGWREIVRRGYAAVYQDTRGRYGSEGEDRVYCDDAFDGYDTVDWISTESWSNNCVGVSGSSAGATTALAAASQGHPSVRAFFAQAGGSSIYDDVVYEGQSIQMERLWLWVAGNIPGLSTSHRQAIMRRTGLTEKDLARSSREALNRFERLDAAKRAEPPFVDSEAWTRLPLIGYPNFTTLQPFLNEILCHPTPDRFREAHNFRATINVPGFHVTSWFDIFQTSVIKAFLEIELRAGNQRLWVGPNAHYFVYDRHFWPRDPYFEWFGYWLKGLPAPFLDEPQVFYSPRSWIDEIETYEARDWLHADQWPPRGTVQSRLHLTKDGGLGPVAGAVGWRGFTYDPERPVPTCGGRNMLIRNGPCDQRTVQGLSYYGLMYIGEELTDGLHLVGSVYVNLHVRSDCPDTDFVAKLIEVLPDGQTLLLMDGITRAMYADTMTVPRPLEPGKIYPVEVYLGEISHICRVGSRLQVDVTSSNFPRHVRNTNSGNEFLAKDRYEDIRVAFNEIHHGGDSPSTLVFSTLTGES